MENNFAFPLDSVVNDYRLKISFHVSANILQSRGY